MDRLDSQVVVITGSSRGFGLAMAKEFQNAGAKVVLCSRSVQSVNEAVQSLPHPGSALALPCDVRNLDEVRNVANVTEAEYGRIDIWVNNAGVAHAYAKITDVKPERWRESFETNFFGTYHGCLTALEKMLPRKRGQIINILGMGADRAAPNQSGYGASKAAVRALTQTLAAEYRNSGLVIYAVQPGMIWTEMLTNAEGVSDPGLRARMEWAMRVFGNPPEAPARYVVALAGHPDGSGKVHRLLGARVIVPRMIGELLGRGKRNPRPWEK